MKRGILFILFLIISNVYAIGISPSEREINFKPNYEDAFSIEIVNNADYDIIAMMQSSGDLSQYVTLKKTTIPIKQGQSATSSYSINLPEKIDKPGMHVIQITAVENLPPNMQTTGIAARTSSTAYLKIFVPYPGKYAEISFKVNNANIDEPVIFNILIKNLGKEIIQSAQATIDIYDKDNLEQKIDTLTTKTFSIPVESEDILIANYLQSKPGVYLAKLRFNYDGNLIQDSAEFKIGTLFVNITNSTKILKKDSINPFNIEIESRWNSKIDNIYAEVELQKNRQKLTQPSKTPSTFLNPWEKETLTAYIDTTGLEPSNYQAKITLFYANKITEKLIDIIILKKLELNTTMLLIGLVILIIIIDILWIILSKRIIKKIKKKS